ncbi:MAG TPA: hypothetical protein DGT21_06675 [Armatimonadetes bacterium]|nr:hypothetical protein [Armatimonadota bacterium]
MLTRSCAAALIIAVCTMLACTGCNSGAGPGTPALTIVTAALTGGQVGELYEATITAVGGIPPYRFAIGGGGLPAGLTLSAQGRITGTPLLEGDYQFTVTVADAPGDSATRRYEIDVAGVADDDDIHVKTTGNDGNTGNADSPFATVQRAVDVAEPGETIRVHTGTYDEDVVFNHSGDPGAPITLAVYNNQNVTITSVELARDVDYIALEGFNVSGYDIWGVTLNGDNSNVAISNLRITGGEAGIRMTVGNSGEAPAFGPVSDVTISDCTVRDTLYTGIDGTPGPCDRVLIQRTSVSGAGVTGEGFFGSDGIAIERGNDITVRNCTTADNGGDGIDLNSRDTAGHATGILVYGNSVYRNRCNGVKLWAGGRLERNAIWGGGLNPLPLGAYDCTIELIRNSVAYNMYSGAFGARDYAMTVGYPEDGRPAPQIDLTMQGRIFAFNTGPAQGTPTGIYLGPGVTLLLENGNLFHSRDDCEIQAEFLGLLDPCFTRGEITNGSWSAATGGQGVNDLTDDPLFVSPWPDVDLHLQQTSPADGIGAY